MKTMKPMRRVLATSLTLAIAAATATAFAQGRASGPNDDIKVHGHWTIDIKDANGSLVARHEFENALQEPGALNIANFLGRVNAPGFWAVFLYGPVGTPDCIPAGLPCILRENTSASTGSSPLTVSVPTTGPNQGKLVLSGSFTSPDARSFNRAISGVSLCPPGSPSCTTGTLGGNFTLKDFPAIAVQAGQIVQVTVVISFS
jgi:hypothetical protein